MSASGLPPTSLPLGVDLSSSVDGLYWGVIISTVLLGVTVVQAWIYVNDNKDGWPLRTYVAVLVGLDITTTALNSQFIHAYFISNFGNLENLGLINKSILVEFAITIIVIFLVQLFFATRVYLLNDKGYIVPAIIVVSAMLSFGAGIYTIVQEWKVPLVAGLDTDKIRISIGIDQLFVLLCDLTATIALSWNLAQAERKSRVKKTVTMLQKLVAFIVARGLLVTVITFIFAIMYIAHPANLYWMPLHLMLSKLYVITMIAILNSRNWIRNSADDATVSSMFANSIGSTAAVRSGTIDPHTVVVSKSSDSGPFELKNFPDSYGGESEPGTKGVYMSRTVDVV
ncbi:hypothetical protein BDN70DRAFT_876585 [Pholiota conissans]|uniref:DUF6534 domain-containing protein n=1 Tax=Pholiota conissans TaxID=109636 RepID=A0A9P5Z528_9AGAR|nr:hypothetical protein BDN70DRAFT_876585 [Pholiota conissans]